MYVTRSLSQYKASPEALYDPPEGPNSGFLVIQDAESETYSCFGLCRNQEVELPFPQNKILTTLYERSLYIGINGSPLKLEYTNEVVFIPVLNQPLSSNRYYAIEPHGSHKGEAFTCSKEEDMSQCCFCSRVRDVEPKPLNTHDMYQQFEILPYKSQCKGSSGLSAKSLANDGLPPKFLRRKGWQVYSKTPKSYELHEAKGVNHSLRSRLPDLNFPPSIKTSSSVIVGKWFCPFVFIKEGKLSDQVKRSIFYEMTLEQRWERVFEHENKNNKEGNVVSVKATFSSEAVFIGENLIEAIWDEKNVIDGVMWFSSVRGDSELKENVGLSLEIIERMRWEEQKVGWVGSGEKRIERVSKDEKIEGKNEWKRFGSYVLVERFVLKRMDGSSVLMYDFGHTHQIKSIFE